MTRPSTRSGVRRPKSANQPYETSARYQPKVGRMHPDPEVVAEAVERLAAASGLSFSVAASGLVL